MRLRDRHPACGTKGFRLTVSVVLLLGSHAAPSSASDLADFKQPSARCVKPSPEVIITQVGRFGDASTGLPELDVVATARPSTDGIAITDHAAITLYDSACRATYVQLFPGAGEVSFEMLHWSGDSLLHVVTMSALNEPADQVIWNHLILEENYDGSVLPIQPSLLTGDKYGTVFVGRFGKGEGDGIVETFSPPQQTGQLPPHPAVVVYQYQDVPLPNGGALRGFVGPRLLPGPPDPKAAYSDINYPFAIGFPLSHFLYGPDGGR